MKISHLLLVGTLIVNNLAWSEVMKVKSSSRRPANYVPDDDIIVRPVDNELSFYQQYVASDNSVEVINSRNQIKVWNDNQAFAEQYGIDSSLAGSPFYVPTQEEKLEYFKSKYMRYLRSRSEEPLREMPQNWYNSYRASNEVDTIDELEARFKSSHFQQKSSKVIPEGLRQKEISIWKKTRIIFQPRLDQGLVVVGIKGPIAYARAWVGVNGQTEINIQKTVDHIGFRFMWNYTANTGESFASIDQHLVGNFSTRLTLQKNPQVDSSTGVYKEDNTLMLLYTKQF